MIFSLIISFAVTVVVEIVVGLLLGLRDRHSLLMIFLVNVVTNPIVVFLLNVEYLYGLPLSRLSLTILLEITAFLTEALLYRYALKGGRNPYFLALVLNAASYLMGVVINILLRQVF